MRLCVVPKCSYSFNDLPMNKSSFLFTTITVKEYERVVGWEGSNAVSPPRDGAAWALRIFLRG